METSRSFFVLFFILLLLIYFVGDGVLNAHGIDSVLLSLLYRAGVIWLFIWWLKADGRKRGVAQPYCLGMLATIGGVIYWPHYLVRTRGTKGLLLIVAYWALVMGGGVIGFVAYLLAGGQLEYYGR